MKKKQFYLEDPPEHTIPRRADEMKDGAVVVDIALLPTRLEFADGYRSDIVVFARSNQPDLVVTNLPVFSVPAEKLALCTNMAQRSLLALSVQEGFSLQFLDQDSTLGLVTHAQVLANEFLGPMLQDGQTVSYPLVDVREWLARQIWWRRSVESPPGTEWA